MVDYIAVKKLSASDMTFLERFHGFINKSNQKCINLNADVFRKLFYPSIESMSADGEFPVDIFVFGPNAPPKIERQKRKVTKGDSYKNWRLNGETLHDPINDPNRFSILKKHDIAVIVFEGSLKPEIVHLVFLAENSTADFPIFNTFSPLLQRKSMIALTPQRLKALLESAAAPSTHPLYTFTADPEIAEALEDAGLGGYSGKQVLRRRRQGRPVSSRESKEMRAAAELIGENGERLVNFYLLSNAGEGGDFHFEWVSRFDAFSPFDFKITYIGNQNATGQRLVEVKSTTGPFGRAFHISIAEILEAAASTMPYHIYRLYELNEDGGTLRISDDFRIFARSLQSAHDTAMPAGVSADGFAVLPEGIGLSWSPPITIVAEDDDANDD